MKQYGELCINMKHMKKWIVTECNVKYYNHIMLNNGVIVTLDKQPYIELLTDFNIFFTAK